MLDRTAPHPRRKLRLPATRFDPHRIPRHASSDRIVPTDQPVRELEPGIHQQRRLQLAHVGPAGSFL